MFSQWTLHHPSRLLCISIVEHAIHLAYTRSYRESSTLSSDETSMAVLSSYDFPCSINTHLPQFPSRNAKHHNSITSILTLQPFPFHKSIPSFSHNIPINRHTKNHTHNRKIRKRIITPIHKPHRPRIAHLALPQSFCLSSLPFLFLDFTFLLSG